MTYKKGISEALINFLYSMVDGHNDPYPQSVVGAKMSVPFTVAVAIKTGWAGPKEFDPVSFNDPEIINLAKTAKLLESLGANTVNLIRDIQVEMYAAVRQAIDIPLDIHTENPASSGGFIRHYEIPEIVRVAAPMYLKTGGSVAKTHSWETTDADARKRAKQVAFVQRVMDQYYPAAIRSERGPKDLAIPV